MTVPDTARQYAISDKTIYGWIANQTKPEISLLEFNRLKKENEELKRIIGIVTLELEREKIEVINMSTNKKLIAGCMHINHKNIYHAHRMFLRDLVIVNTLFSKRRVRSSLT